MKKRFFLIAVVSSLILSCSSKPEEACHCIKKAANTYIEQGLKLTSKQDLRLPCEEIIDEFENNAEARAMIISCGEEALKAIRNKEFINIEGEEFVYPTYTFSTLSELRNEVEGSEDNYYKYWKADITIEKVFLSKVFYRDDIIGFGDNGNDYRFEGFDQQAYKDVGFGLFMEKDKMKKEILNKLKNPVELKEDLVWDVDSLQYIDGLTHKNMKSARHIGELIKGPTVYYDYYNGEHIKETSAYFENYRQPTTRYDWYSKKLEYTRNTGIYSTIIEDLKRGRFKYISKEDFEKIAGRGKTELCLISAKIKGQIMKNGLNSLSLQLSDISDIEVFETPGLFTEPGEKIDLSQYDPIYKHL
ncbi:MAG: hypothetical protein H6584_06535 [Flavobacteriales bacterium]|nr:hypothetical protein [Flavobacteriales bacterium]